MEIVFASREIKKICEDPSFANRKLGSASAKKLQTRLADLMAAARLGDIPAGNPHPLRGDREGQFALRLSGGDRLVFDAQDDPVPTTIDESIDWKNVTSIRVVFIGDYHD